MKMLWDLKSLGKSLIINLAVAAIWYAAEYDQFGELQLDRVGDNIIWFLYLIIFWWMFHRMENRKDD